MNAIGCASPKEHVELCEPSGTITQLPLGFAEWASRITHLYQQGTTRTLELARVVAQARKTLRRGQWAALWKSKTIPFSKRKGDMLVKIDAALGGLPHEQTSAHFPRGWNILYQLAQLDRPTLERHILNGIVHARLTLEGAKRLVREFRGKTPDNTKQPNFERWLKKVNRFVGENLRQWSGQERERAEAEFLKLSRQVAAHRNVVEQTTDLLLRGHNLVTHEPLITL